MKHTSSCDHAGSCLDAFLCLACRLPRVAAAAAAIACHWQQLGGLGGVPFALPASSPSSRPSKGTLLPSAHQMGSVGRPTAAPHPVGQGSSASGATKGQDLALSEGQDQRLMHLIDSRGVGRGGSHSDGALTHPGSHEVADRCCTSSFMLFMCQARDGVDLVSGLVHDNKNRVHNDYAAPKPECTAISISSNLTSLDTTRCTYTCS